MKIQKELYMRISSLTGIDYEGVIVNQEEYYFENETIIVMIKDLIYEIGFKEEKIEDLEKDIRDNYVAKNIDPYVEYGLSEKDFY